MCEGLLLLLSVKNRWFVLILTALIALPEGM